MEVELPASSRRIGAAAEFGDVSDSAEFQSAIEEQGRLQARAAEIQNELARARAINADDVPTDSVGVGSRVLLKRAEDGREELLTFLGPWDSDPARRVYNYQSPLALGLMGKTAGETVTLNIDGAEADYRIERIESAL